MVARCSGNAFAGTVVATLGAALSSDIFEIARNFDVHQDLSFHDRIVDALAAGNAAASEAAMREHVEAIVARVRKAYPEVLEQPVRWM